jgi:hypothetical protein
MGNDTIPGRVHLAKVASKVNYPVFATWYVVDDLP